MDGILIVNKPQGMTSHDVIDFIRGRFGIKKAGHAGTLDPMATGVLVVLLGKYTKSSQAFSADDKEYEAVMTLGGRSDTGDAWGKVVSSGMSVDFPEEQIEAAFAKYLGEIEQMPPMYSAVKVNGRKLYELARKGLTVETKPRTIHIKELKLSDISIPKISFRLTCSKGTYVRQLCVDIGEDLGCGGYLSELERTRSGKFTIDSAISVDGLKDLKAADLAKKVLL
jgi:tRNA pseudouridine55 synthase